MEEAQLKWMDVLKALAADKRSQALALRGLIIPAAVSVAFPFYVLGAVAWSQFSLQRGVESFSTEELQKFDAGNVQVMSGEVFGRPEARLTIRYLSANNRTVAVVSANAPFVVEAPLLRSLEFQVAAQANYQIN